MGDEKARNKIPVPSHLVHAVKHSDMCRKCVIEYYKLYKDGKVEKPFPVMCSGDARVQRVKDDDTLWALKNPVTWAEFEFNDPDKPTQPFKLRWYQSDMLSCTARYKALRWGRRTGKTHSAVVGILHQMFVYGHKVIVLTPFEKQINEIFRKLHNFIYASKAMHLSLIHI